MTCVLVCVDFLALSPREAKSHDVEYDDADDLDGAKPESACGDAVHGGRETMTAVESQLGALAAKHIREVRAALQGLPDNQLLSFAHGHYLGPSAAVCQPSAAVSQPSAAVINPSAGAAESCTHVPSAAEHVEPTGSGSPSVISHVPTMRNEPSAAVSQPSAAVLTERAMRYFSSGSGNEDCQSAFECRSEFSQVQAPRCFSCLSIWYQLSFPPPCTETFRWIHPHSFASKCVHAFEQRQFGGKRGCRRGA